MSLSLYDITMPVFIREMKIIGTLLEKGRSHVSDEQSLFDAKLADDMAAFPFQIQSISDTAKGVAARVAKVEPVVMKDEEKNFAELQERLVKTIAVLEKVDPKAMQAAAGEEVVLRTRKFATAEEYILTYAIPNFYFHVCMVYALLRREGVPIGKKDYLGIAPSQSS